MTFSREQANEMAASLERVVNGLAMKKINRRFIRRIILRIRNHKHFEKEHKPYVIGIKLIYEKHFNNEINWSTFTYTWDLNPKNPLEIVRPNQWQSAGGEFWNKDRHGNDGKVLHGMHKPTAFTHQALD